MATLQILVTATGPDNQQVSASFTLTVQPPLTTGQGLGLLGTYYNGTDFNSFCFDEIDPQVSFNWGDASPGASVDGQDFSVIWTGQVLAPQSGLYTFYTYSYDGARLWVNGQQLIGNWDQRDGPKTPSTLQAGQLYDLTMEYNEGDR